MRKRFADDSDYERAMRYLEKIKLIKKASNDYATLSARILQRKEKKLGWMITSQSMPRLFTDKHRKEEEKR